MTTAEQRARQYMDLRRWDSARAELATAIASEPDNGLLYAMLASCLAREGKKKDALANAKRGVALSPDQPYPHYILAYVYQVQGNLKLAEASARRALVLNPDNSSSHSMLSGIFAMQRRWRDALEAADAGLRLDPSHQECLRMRAQALSFSGQLDAARAAAVTAVAGEPDSAKAHEELGWVSLRAGDHKSAQSHFKEALRLDPNSERSRKGLLESLRAIVPPYRWMFQFWTQLSRVPGPFRFVVLFALIGATNSSNSTTGQDSPMKLILVPLTALVAMFFYMSLFGQGLLNVFLLLHPIGRLAMIRDERLQAWMLSAFLIAVPVLAAISLLSPLHLWVSFAMAAVGAFLMALLGRLESSGTTRTLVVWITFVITSGILLISVFAEILGPGQPA